MNKNKLLFKNKEYIRLSIYLIIIVVLTIPLLNIFMQSWEMEGGLMKLFANAIWDFHPSGVIIIITFIAGFYLGSLLLMTIDEYKRVQSLLLWIGVIIIVYYVINGNIFPNVNWINNISILGMGVLIGVFIGGGKDLLNDKNELKFQKASNNLTFFSIFFIIFAVAGNYMPFLLTDDLAEININNIFGNIFIAIIFIYFFGAFVTYTAKSPKLFILGPLKSGKSLLLAGCYLKALKKMKSQPTNANENLLLLIENLHKEFYGEEYTWPESTSTPMDYHFVYKTGSLFPKKVFFKTLDYPGIYLDHIYDYMDMKKNENTKNVFNDEKDESKEFEKQLAQISQEIFKSKKLLFIIDAEKFPHFEEMGIIHYINILEKLYRKKNMVDTYIVITKCDIFLEEYNEKNDTKDDFMIDYDDFKDFTKQKIERNVLLRTLINESSGALFYPVFYYTKKNIRGEYLPIRDEYNNVFTFGFDELMYDLI